MGRKQVDPVVEIVGTPVHTENPAPAQVEETPTNINAGKILPGVLNVGSIQATDIGDNTILDEGPDPEDLPETSLEEDYAAFKGFVLQTLSDLDERIRDVETVAGAAFVESAEAGALAELFGEGSVSREEQPIRYREPNEDEDVPEYVAEYRQAHTPGDSDGTPWF